MTPHQLRMRIRMQKLTQKRLQLIILREVNERMREEDQDQEESTKLLMTYMIPEEYPLSALASGFASMVRKIDTAGLKPCACNIKTKMK